MDALMQQIETNLAEPFDPSEIKWKPQAVKGNRALAIAYVDARVVQDRLDRVCGVAGWQDHYEFLPDGSVLCRLQIRIGGEWITKMDLGGQSEQADEGDRRKAAISDALKRAAVKFGVGRYLYRLASQWVGYDPQQKRFTETPKLPPSAVAKKAEKVRKVADGAELLAREEKREAGLVNQGRCQPGELIAHLRKQASLLGVQEDIVNWSAETLAHASDWIRTFLSLHNQPEPNGAPAASPPAPRITREKAKELQALIAKKGRSWARKAKGDAGDSICHIFDLPETTMIEDLTPLKYAEIRKALLEERDFVRA